MFSFGFGALLVLVILLVWSFRILREYERGVVFNLGRYWAVKGPGWFILIPVIQQMVKMDLRTVVLDVPPQDVISRDNVSVKVNAVVYFRVVDPQKAVIQVADFLNATSQLAQTTLRAVLGKQDLDDRVPGADGSDRPDARGAAQAEPVSSQGVQRQSFITSKRSRPCPSMPNRDCCATPCAPREASGSRWSRSWRSARSGTSRRARENRRSRCPHPRSTILKVRVRAN